VEHDGRPVAAMTTDEALGDHPELLAAAAQATLIAVRTGHLEGELRDSRRRLLEAATTERRRIQRDLHDSAQQRLVALEALQDAAEHAGDGAEATVRLGACDAGVWFSVSDDGVGFRAPVAARHGPVEPRR